jgi:tetratricopeptide (TPR) repeat protein
MPINPNAALRISTIIVGSGLSFTLELTEPESNPLRASGVFSGLLPATLWADLRWYLEQFLDEQDEAALVRAKQVRETIKGYGKRLFQDVFQSTSDGRQIWRRVAQGLSRTKIEIHEGIGTTRLPWELLRDPTTNAPVCLSSATFVRIVESATQSAAEAVSKLKILLVISRPDGTEDVEYRTIASTIFDSLRTSPRFEVVVLRPPTYEQLARTLRDAASDGEPYDLVHFDGHGFYQHPILHSCSDEDAGGYIVFENGVADGGQPVSGSEFAALASGCGVKAVVLNACRSAYQEPIGNEASRPTDSFAHSLLIAGVPGVIAMNFNVYVVSARRFMEEFYRQLERGQTLSMAASLARKNLSTDRLRFHHDSSAIYDWLVPAIYLAGHELQVEMRGDGRTERTSRTLPQAFPPAPELGFVGSDDALLQIDRSFDAHNIVLLYGLAGAGKSAASVEFSSWYQETRPNGLTLLFTSFGAGPTLDQVLVGAEPLIGHRIAGLNLKEATVQDSIILSLASKGTLWVWDNVETIARMNTADRKDFTNFLRRVAGSGLQLLLTGRDPQENWLHDLAIRIEMPALRLSESIELTKRILSRKGLRKFDGSTWIPLLEFAGGNPLTLHISISSYLTNTRRPSPETVQTYVDSLRRGIVQLGDSQSDDRSKSLTASLNYGFDHAFDEHEIRILSLLSLFRAYVNTFTILIMCRPITDSSAAGMPDHDFSWTIPGLERETPQSIEGVLDKATELGVLRKTENHNFWLHPAIHLHLMPSFNRLYSGTEARQTAEQAYTEAVGYHSIQFTRHLQAGVRARVIEALGKERDNLEQALYLSHQNGWLQAEVGILHGLNALLLHEGRFEEWKMVFASVWEDFVAPDLNPQAGKERFWSFILDHRLRIAMEDGDLDQAENIARLIKNYEEGQTREIVRQAGHLYSNVERKRLNDLAIAIGRLADVLRQQDNSECVALNEEALAIYKLIQEKPGIAIRHLNLGHCYKNIEAIRDLQKSEQNYQDAYSSYPETDRLARAQCLAQISMIWIERVEEEAERGPVTADLEPQLNAAVAQYEQALRMLPPDALGEIANLHNHLGNALGIDPSRHEDALQHYRTSCQYAITVGQYYEAATVRGNFAQLLSRMGRRDEAVAAAQQALAELRAIGVIDGELISILQRIERRGY